MRLTQPSIRPERIAAYLTLLTAILGLAERLRWAFGQVRAYREGRRRKREGFGFRLSDSKSGRQTFRRRQ